MFTRTAALNEPQLLGTHPGADLKAPTADEERIQGTMRFVELRAICKVVADYQQPDTAYSSPTSWMSR